MVSAQETLQASTEISIAVIPTELQGLVYPTMTIAKVSSLWVTEMDAEAFSRAWQKWVSSTV